MTVTATVLIPAKQAENIAVQQYLSSGRTTIIDKFTATNTSAAAATLSVFLVSANTVEGDYNLIVDAKSIAPGATYTFPELVGHVLLNGGSIITLASAANSLTIRASGRGIT